ISFLVLILVSFLRGGRAGAGIGLVGLFSMIFSIVGLVLGALNVKNGDRTWILTKAGFFVNVVFVLVWAVILVFGVYN
ncbi:MAG: hypothetical protein IKZ65_05750, partial [Lachnospiraceae bacterium]|nr:hypothetical protein [Lachnospiraceae bacterium]